MGDETDAIPRGCVQQPGATPLGYSPWWCFASLEQAEYRARSLPGDGPGNRMPTPPVLIGDGGEGVLAGRARAHWP
jgi:hypothetical protein